VLATYHVFYQLLLYSLQEENADMFERSFSWEENSLMDESGLTGTV
jgi:hypothetical protein